LCNEIDGNLAGLTERLRSRLMMWQRMSFSEPFGVQKDLGTVESPKEFGFVALQGLRQTVERDEAGRALEDTIERARNAALRRGEGSVR
jgi:hypothetical protein